MSQGKQRYQVINLGDTIRLQNFVFNNAYNKNSSISVIPKIDIFFLNPKDCEPDLGNLEGRSYRKTIVFNPLEGNIYPYPSSASVDYWEHLLETNSENWSIGKYVDKWYLIFDKDYDLEGKSFFNAHQASLDQNLPGEFVLPMVKNRLIQSGGVFNDGSHTYHSDLLSSVTDFKSMDIPSDFLNEPVTLAGIIQYGGGDHDACFFKAWTSDYQSWGVSLVSNTSEEHYVTNLNLEYSSENSRFIFSPTWNSIPDSNSAMFLWFVEKWDLTAPYLYGVPNAWDDLYERTHPSYKATSEYDFEINPELWLSVSRPIITKYKFVIDTYLIYTGCVNYIRVGIKPSGTPMVNNAIELEAYYYQAISMSQITYEIYAYTQDGKAKKIYEGDVYWQEGNVAIIKIDTSVAPFHKPMEMFMFTYVKLPDGSVQKSTKFELEISDGSEKNSSQNR